MMAVMGGLGNAPVPFYFVLRPEELSYEIPSRSVVHSTLGGAWIDDFGIGIKTIHLSGHAGWREGGEPWFILFRELVYETYFRRRLEASNSGQDPDDIGLYYADTLNLIMARVHPTEFIHKRSKTKPLLHQYSIKLSVVKESGVSSLIGGLIG